MNGNENSPEKSYIPKKIRIIALVLVVLLAGEIIFSNAIAVSFSSRDYAGSEYEQAAEYIEQNDEYLSAGTLARMRAVASTLGEPKTYRQYSLFASIAIADREYTKAADYLLKAIDVYQGNDAKEIASVYVKVGCLRALLKSWSAAAGFFEKAIELDAENPSPWLMLCEANLNSGNYEKALSSLEKYSTLTELSRDEFDALVQLQINLEKYDDALSSCKTAEQNSTAAAADIALYRAQIHYMKGEYSKAIEQAELSRSNGENIAEAGAIIAFCSEEAGDHAGALKACLSVIDAGLADLSVYQQAAQAAYQISDYSTTIRVSEEALEKFGDTDDTLVFKKWLGISFFETNDLANAEKNLTSMIESGESMPELNYLRGICKMASEEYDAAVSDFTASLASEELKDEALYNRALCYIKLENTDAAANDFQKVLDRGSDEEVVKLICDLLGITPDQPDASIPG